MAVNLVAFAEQFAAAHHAGQLYGQPPRPYIEHCREVVACLHEAYQAEYGVPAPDDLVAACWLHDVIEDCGVSAGTVAYYFGQQVASAVWACTKGTEGTRKQKMEVSYDRLKLSPSGCLVKAADRLANMRESWKPGGSEKHGKMYAIELPHLVVALTQGKQDACYQPVIAHLIEAMHTLVA